MIPNLDSNIIDVAGGTGDIAFRIKARGKELNQNPYIVICDINQEMLKVCKDKAINKNILHGIDLVVGNAEKLPFADNSFDYYTIAFGIRNMLSIEEDETIVVAVVVVDETTWRILNRARAHES